MTAEKPSSAIAGIEKLTLKEQICRLLQWDEMQYAEYQYKNGIAYLYWYLPCDAVGRDKLERSKLYWNWFKKQYQLHDHAFTVSPGIGLERLSKRRRLYAELHDAHSLSVEVKPNSVVLNELLKPVKI